jgi:hypothetical protein
MTERKKRTNRTSQEGRKEEVELVACEGEVQVSQQLTTFPTSIDYYDVERVLCSII